MGILKSIRKNSKKSLKKVEADLKRAEANARKYARDEAKADLRTAQLLDKAEKRLLKEEKKGLKRKRKHEQDLAKAHLKRIDEAGLTKKKVKNFTGAARVLVPVLLPLAYKALTASQQRNLDNRAAGLGLSSQDIARHSGRGAELKARIDAIRANLERDSNLPKGFTEDARVRLADLDQAVRNAENASPVQQDLAHNAIEQDITDLAAEVHKKARD